MKLAHWLERVKHSYTQAELADILGCTQASVSRYLSGHRVPTLLVMHQIMKLTGGAVTPNDFHEQRVDILRSELQRQRAEGRSAKQQGN